MECAVVNAVQNITTYTAWIPAVQLVQIYTSFLSSDTPQPEVQEVMCDAIGGSFRLTFNGYVTASIPYNADTTTIANALQQLQIINTVIVSFSNGSTQACLPQADYPGTSFIVNFTSVVGLSGDLPLLSGTTNSLQGLRRIVVTELVRGEAGLGGTFRLSYRGEMTTDISVFALPSDIATALGDLDTLPLGGLIVNDYRTDLTNPQGRLWGITFAAFELGGTVEALQVVTAFNEVTGSDARVLIYADGASLPVNESTSAPASVAGNQVSGSFSLTLDGYTVGPIAFDVADTVLATQLESLPNVGVVSVQRLGPTVLQEYTWLVTFLSMPGYFPPGTGTVDLLQATYYGTLGGNSSEVVVTSISAGSEPLSGTFTLTYTNGTYSETTVDIPADASADELAYYLNSLNVIGAVSVTRLVLGNGYSWFITFDGCKVVNGTDVCNEGIVPLLSFNSSLLSCAASPMSVLSVLEGVGPGTNCVSGSCSGFLTDLSGAPPYTYILNGLTTGIPYFVRVLAHNSLGYGLPAITQPESVITTYNPPGPPPPVQLVSSTISTITVSWQLPHDNGGAPIVGYELWMDDWAGGNPRLVYDGTDVPNILSFTVGSVSTVILSAGKSYRFMVRALNYCISTKPTTICLGSFSDVSVFTARAPRAPLAPPSPYRSSKSNIGTNAIGDATIYIRWNPPIDNGGSPITGYLLYWAAPGSASYTEVSVGIPQISPASAGDVLEYPIHNLLEGSIYRFYIVALNALGRSAASPVLSAIAGTFAGIDANDSPLYSAIAPTLTSVDSSSISMSWPLPTSNSTGGMAISGYRLWMYPGVPLNTIAYPTVVFQASQLISTSLSSGTSAPISGSFTISFNGTSTLDMPFNVSASEMQTALQDLPGVFSVSVNMSENANGGLDWLVYFNSIAGSVELLMASSGRLNPVGSAFITVSSVVPGTPAILAYDGTDVPEVRSVTISGLLSATTYAFKVAPLNYIGDGVLSAASVTVVTTEGASASYTSAYGSSLTEGITDSIDEQQILTTSNCGNSLINLYYNGLNVTFSNNATAQELEYLLITVLGFEGGALVDKSFSVNASVDQLNWLLVFPESGDIATLMTSVPGGGSCFATVTEFVKGNRNQFTIQPRTSSGAVLRDTVTAAGFAGKNIFFTESWMNGTWYRDQGVATYNPVTYEVQEVFIPTSVSGGVVLLLPDYLTPSSTVNFTTPSFSASSSAATVQAALEQLNNVNSVDVSRVVLTSGVSFMVTFLSNLGVVPLLRSLNNLVQISEVQQGICEVQAVVLATDTDFSTMPSNGTFTISYDGEFTPDINVDASAAEMKAALETLSFIGTVLVTRETNGNGFRWTISFTSLVGDLDLMSANPYRYEVQMLQTFGGSPTPLSGMLALSYGGDSVMVSYDASAADMSAALESMPSVGTVQVSKISGMNGQNAWTVTFRTLIGAVSLIAVDVSMLFGSDAAATVSQVVIGNSQTLVGYNPRLNVQKIIPGRPDYTGYYTVDKPGLYQTLISELVKGGLFASYWDNQVMPFASLRLYNVP